MFNFRSMLKIPRIPRIHASLSQESSEQF